MPANLPKPQATLSLREISRATLSRQLLLERAQIGAVEAIERLAGMQAQYSPAPYVGLWTRLLDFKHDALTEAIESRQVVKATLMRSTLHLLSARDYPYFNRIASEAALAYFGRDIKAAGLDSVELNKLLLQHTEEPRLMDEMIALLDLHVPPQASTTEHERRMLWHWVTAHGGYVHVPPSGTWRAFGKNSFIAAHKWLGTLEEPSPEEAVVYVLRRYLAAFGPASRADAVQWGGLKSVSLVDRALEALGDEIVAFKGEGGTVLYDLASAPRPGADVPAPVRFLPKFDNLLLAYKDRERVLPERYRKVVVTKNLQVLATFLVDGVVAGLWTTDRKRDAAILSIEPLEPLSPQTLAELREEGERLIRFIEPDASTFAVEIAA